MHKHVAKRMGQIHYSGIRTIFESVSQLERQGYPIIHLEIGQPDFDTPEHIKQAAYNALYEGQVQYTSNYGILPLRRAIASKLKRENALIVDPETELIVTTGVSEAIMITMMALLNPGDEVLIMEPLFPCYPMSVRMAGAVPVSVPTYAVNNYQTLRSGLEGLVTLRTKMLVLTTPGNPTGTLLNMETLRELADFSIQHNLLVVADEIYEKLIYDGSSHISIASLPGMGRRTLTLNGFSKSYAMTGWRLGYVAADKSLIQALVRIHQYSVVCSTSFAQWGAVAALEGTQEPMRQMVAELNRRRLMLIEALNKIPDLSFCRPQGAMYVYIDVSQIAEDAYVLAEELLYCAHVAVVPWDSRHIRISYSTSYDDIKIAMEKMQNFFSGDLLSYSPIGQ